MSRQRASGILLHPTSLPGPHGLGDLGLEAFRFVDFLVAAGQTVWQVLPLGPTGYGDSPYSAYSAFAGNPLLISLERLVEEGDLAAADIAGIAQPEGAAQFGFVHGCKGRLLHKAAAAFAADATSERRRRFAAFCTEQAGWLEDYALFRALHRHNGERPWMRWPEEVRDRRPEALAHWRGQLADLVAAERYAQFVFFEQWFALKDYANRHGVQVLGDLPIFVAHDSADVWAQAELFHLDPAGEPTLVAGVPPDYFSATGQRWGNPLYRWERLAETGFAWWRERMRWSLRQFDQVRIDHFRGFEACWAIPADAPTAVAGEWLPVPGAALFEVLQKDLGGLPLVAEDLGIITPAVEALRDGLGLPGMKILQFAFGSGPHNPYLPFNLTHSCVIYTGTHDNDTTIGWWRTLDAPTRAAVSAYLGGEVRDIHWQLLRLALASVADLCIVPLQDLLGLGSEARMNTPGQPGGNWCWRYLPGGLDAPLAMRMRELTVTYGRASRTPCQQN